MLILEDVKFSYQNIKFNFSFKLKAMESLGIIGPSGAGKSTLLNIIAGFHQLESGKILLDEQDITNLIPSKRSVNLVFQENNLFSSLSVFNNIAIGIRSDLKLKDIEREKVIKILQKVGLTGLQNRYPEDLSVGQRQRVAIARAMVRHSKIILLDEPFSALDYALRLEMLQLVRQIHHEQASNLIMVSHYPEDCLTLCDKIAFLANGEFVYIKNSNEINKEGLIADLQKYGLN